MGTDRAGLADAGGPHFLICLNSLTVTVVLERYAEVLAACHSMPASFPRSHSNRCSPISATVYRSDLEETDDLTNGNPAGPWASHGVQCAPYERRAGGKE